jgi:CheY-like chemotaxis protein/HPt (histidine-containing phosphotransfer) domain-containing protein
MSQDQLPLLFNTFTQLDNTTTKSFGGTGLGLVISKQLCELMNGTVGVKSAIGKGSTFWFTFEVPAIAPFDVNIYTVPNLISTIDFKGLNVLVVDDNAVNRKVATEILKTHNCVVDTASNGKEAIDKILENEYAIVLMDIQMPVMDGVSATIEIRRISKKKLPPIIAMTAYSMKEDKLKYLSLGMDDYIAKPIRVETLLSKIQEWLGVEVAKVNSGNLIANTLSEADKDIDDEILNQLLKYGGENVIKEMLEDFVFETSELLNQSNQAFALNDLAQLKSCIHTIKGSAGTLGVLKVTAIATMIDEQLNLGNYKTLQELMEKLNKTFNDFLIFYNVKYCN